MSRKNERSSPLTMTSEKALPKEFSLRDLKQNYARRKDNIDLIKSNNTLASVIRLLTEQFCRNRGHL